MTRFGLGALMVLIVALTLTIAWELPPAVGPSVPVPVRVDPAPAPAGSVAAGDGSVDRLPGWATVALGRPLFSPSRRPDAISAADTAAQGLPRLAGILTGPFGKRAIFDAPASGKSVTIGEGDKIEGYVLRKIESDRVTVTGPSGAQDLRPAFRNGRGSQENEAPAQPDVRRVSLQRGPSDDPNAALEADRSGDPAPK